MKPNLNFASCCPNVDLKFRNVGFIAGFGPARMTTVSRIMHEHRTMAWGGCEGSVCRGAPCVYAYWMRRHRMRPENPPKRNNMRRDLVTSNQRHLKTLKKRQLLLLFLFHHKLHIQKTTTKTNCELFIRCEI